MRSPVRRNEDHYGRHGARTIQTTIFSIDSYSYRCIAQDVFSHTAALTLGIHPKVVGRQSPAFSRELLNKTMLQMSSLAKKLLPPLFHFYHVYRRSLNHCSR